MNKAFRILVMAVVIILATLFLNPLGYSYKPDSRNKYSINAVDIINLVKENNLDNSHPRLMIRKADIKRIKMYMKDDKFIINQFNNLRLKADTIIESKPVKYELTDGVRLLSVSRMALDRIQTLGLMYNITGEEKYARRGWLELQTICDSNPDREHYKFPDWHPSHFLDTAEMTNAAAIGYDWLYNYLNEGQRTIVREAIYNRGIKEALKSYESNDFWTNTSSNWSAVCNSGVALGALAIIGDGEKYGRYSGRMLESAINNISSYLSEYTEKGALFEGPDYWDYATTYCGYFISSLDSAVGTDYGITNRNGFEKAGDYLIYMTGPKGVFNYGDSQENKIKTPVMVWLSNKFNNGEYFLYYKKVISSKDSSPMSIVWYNDKVCLNNYKIQDSYFSNVEVATVHTSLLNDNDTFLAVKAGKNGISHGDLDLGTFVYDTMGERWFEDLGSEDYNVEGYWDMGQYGGRWKYYRKRAEGHNTLSINDANVKADQNVHASTRITRFESNTVESNISLDLSDAYAPNVLSEIRNFTLLKEENRVIIEDLIKPKNNVNLSWHAHTTADVELSQDNRTAFLYKNGKRLMISIKSPENLSFYLQSVNSKDKKLKKDNESYFICNDIIINLQSRKDLKVVVEISQ